MSSHFALETATFRAEITDDMLTARQEAMRAIARELEGFVSSRLIRKDDGTLADEVVWSSRESALNAAANALHIPEAVTYFSHLSEIISMEHAEILTDD